MKQYIKYVKPYKWYFILGPLCMVGEVIGDILLPYLTSLIINVGAANRDIGYIIKMGGVMAVASILMMLAGLGGSYFGVKASASFAADLRKDVFHQIQKFSFSNIDTFSTGSLITRLTNDVTQVQNLVLMMLRMMFRSPGMLIGAVIMAFTMNAELAMVILIIVPILATAIGLIIYHAFPRFENVQRKLDTLNSRIQEALRNVRVIKSFVREDYEEEKFKTANGDLKEASMKAFKLMICQQPVITIAMNAATLSVVWFGGSQIIVGDMEVGNLTAFITYITQILMALTMLSMGLLQSSRAIASGKRISQVLNAEIDITDDQAKEKGKEVVQGKVEFRNVSFRYYKDNEEKVLDDLNFVIEPGQTVGIIGSTGSGKSTLVQMISRLYDPDEGCVLVDDVNVKDYTLRHLRDGVAMVLQKNVLFSGTILENMEWGDEKASLEQIIEATIAAQAHSFVENFPGKYETELGQGGVNVSGGQKQRLCIARALLKKPKILILDDSTSAVDTATESKIRESFYTTLKETTKIIIAQRITSVMEADQIIVLDEGQIVGIGKHHDLLNTCEAYGEIYYSQKDKEETV